MSPRPAFYSMIAGRSQPMTRQSGAGDSYAYLCLRVFRWPARSSRRSTSRRCRANLARARALAPGTQVLAVVKADAYGHGLMRVLPALEQADGLALLELERGGRAARAPLHAAHPADRRIFRRAESFAEIAQRRLAIAIHHRGPGTDAGARDARASARGLRQGQHRHEPARLSRRRGRGVSAVDCRNPAAWRRCA